MHNTITSGEIAAFLHKLAAGFDAMPAGPVPGSLHLTVQLSLHRHDGDATTNQALMAFTDAIAAATGTAPPRVDGRTYRNADPDSVERLEFAVTAFLKTGKPVIEIDPNL